jgi:dolichol-phosphate mannosyltransferase
VIPVFDEQDTLSELHRQIEAVSTQAGILPEIIFVDDGSRDQSWSVIRELAASHAMTRAIRFRRNFGKAAALAAGFELASSEYVITLDADLQDDPAEIVRFLEKLEQGFDCVSGWKRIRHDPWHKVLPSRVFNWIASRLTGVQLHDHNCGFKAYRRQIFDEVKLYGELHRFVPILASAKGWRVAEIEVHHRARAFGRSKYGLSRLLKGFLDLTTIYFLTGFSQRPLHLIGTVGLGSLVTGGLGLGWLSMQWILSRQNTNPNDDVHLHASALFYFCILAVLLGAQLLVAGLLAELLVAIARDNKKPYSIAEQVL